MPTRRSEKLRVWLPSTNRVEASVETVRPATVNVSAAVVGGSESTLPSSSDSPAPFRSSLSTLAVLPDTTTTISIVCAACTGVSDTVASVPPPLMRSCTPPGGTFVSGKRPAASTPELIDVPTTVTVTPDSAAPEDAARIALAPPCTVPLIVAALGDEGDVDVVEVVGEVGDAPWLPHADSSRPPHTSIPN